MRCETAEHDRGHVMADDSVALDFGRLFEAAPGLFLVLRPDAPRFTILGATDAYLRATLTQRTQISGRALFEVFPDNPDDPAATGTSNLRASLERVVASQAPDTMAVQQYDIRRPASEGGGFEQRYWSPINSPVLSDTGELLYLLHRVEDVTDVVRAREQARAKELEVLQRSQELAAANEELRDANRRLAELDEAKMEFFSNVSHEFRTPLTLMLGPIDDALADTSRTLPTADRERLQLVRHNALRLLKLVDTLLDFSRIEAGRLRATFVATDLGRLTTDLASVFGSAVQKANLRFVVHCPTLSEPAYVDREMWEKIVLNLIANAFKFTLEGEIGVTVRETQTSVELEVIDTGIGIAPEDQRRVFERFHRVRGPRARSHEGTGIGLSLVQELAKLHGGAVTLDSAPGRGSRFVVAIPKGSAHLPREAVADHATDTTSWLRLAHGNEAARWDAGPPRAATVAPAPASTEPFARDDGHRVLLVDDNADLRAYVASLLAPYCIVEAACDGIEGLARAIESQPDLVLSDVMMPGLDGLGLLRALRDDPRTRRIPVILLSARAGEEAAVEGLAATADDYLAKPFSARELIARVRTHAGLSRTRREWAQQLEEALGEARRQQQRAEDASTAKSRFLAGMSHELRTPLNTILGFAEVLMQTKLVAVQREYVEYVVKGSRQLLALVNELLDLSKIEAGRLELHCEPVCLAALVRDVCVQVQPLGAAASVNLRVDLASDLTVHADAMRLRQVFLNLLSNAIKFTPPGGSIDITAEALPDHIAIKVADTGIGISPENLPRMFREFEQVHDASTRREGTGLGLVLVRKLVELHGGSISVASNLGRGSTFTIDLPVRSLHS